MTTLPQIADAFAKIHSQQEEIAKLKEQVFELRGQVEGYKIELHTLSAEKERLLTRLRQVWLP